MTDITKQERLFLDVFKTFGEYDTSSSAFLWDCFPNAVSLIGFNTFGSFYVVYSPDNFCIYTLEVFTEWSYSFEDAFYRWVNPNYQEAYREEHSKRGHPYEEAFDDTKWVDIEVIDDLFDKAAKIMRNEEHDRRVTIPLELSDDEALVLMKQAHERDITFNQYIVDLLKRYMEEIDIDNG